jgi:arylformamidase
MDGGDKSCRRPVFKRSNVMKDRYFDLTHPMINGAPHYPGDPVFSVASHSTISLNGFSVHRMETGTHQGTHVDAPSHYIEGGATVDRIDLSKFIGLAILLRMPKDAGKVISPDDFAPYANLIVEGSRVIVATGWSTKWTTPEYFENPPQITPEAAGFLASRKIALLGIDMPTPGHPDREIHKILLEANIAILENLLIPDACPEAFTLYAAPLALKDCDGSPVRAVAVRQD